MGAKTLLASPTHLGEQLAVAEDACHVCQCVALPLMISRNGEAVELQTGVPLGEGHLTDEGLRGPWQNDLRRGFGNVSGR